MSASLTPLRIHGVPLEERSKSLDTKLSTRWRAVLLLGFALTLPVELQAATVWTGPHTTFAKSDYADPTLPANQDRLTSNVWLTRADQAGLFNAAQEPAYDDSSTDSPRGTEWAEGTTANYATLDYKAWVEWVGEAPPSVIGKNAVLHLIAEDIYLDIKFTSWTQLAKGGGFSYERSTPATTGATASAIEYYHAGFDHYFVTSQAAEIANLDNGTIQGWMRTGLAFNVYPNATAGASSVCRFFSTAFDPKSSHFYTPFAAECAALKTNPSWQFEGEGSEVFFIGLPGADGTCATGMSPIYRLYNNGQGGAPNHRYTTAINVRDQMVAAGWVIEGNGPGLAFMCAP